MMAVSTSGDLPRLPTIRFVESTSERVRTKTFEVKVKGEVMLQTMIMKLDNNRKIFEDICLKCNRVCKADQVKIHYPVNL